MKLQYLALATALATTSLFLVACGDGSSSESKKTPDSATATNAPDKTSDATRTATSVPDKTSEATRTATRATTAPIPGSGGGGRDGT